MTYTEKCRWLATFYRKAADEGRGMQFRRATEWDDSQMGPCMDSDPDQWRLKPEPPKAWVVWGPGGPSAIIGEDIARQYARECGGTIQEITRPDK
jgi:hypothetical protein